MILIAKPLWFSRYEAWYVVKLTPTAWTFNSSPLPIYWASIRGLTFVCWTDRLDVLRYSRCNLFNSTCNLGWRTSSKGKRGVSFSAKHYRKNIIEGGECYTSVEPIGQTFGSGGWTLHLKYVQWTGLIAEFIKQVWLSRNIHVQIYYPYPWHICNQFIKHYRK